MSTASRKRSTPLPAQVNWVADFNQRVGLDQGLEYHRSCHKFSTHGAVFGDRNSQTAASALLSALVCLGRLSKGSCDGSSPHKLGQRVYRSAWGSRCPCFSDDSRRSGSLARRRCMEVCSLVSWKEFWRIEVPRIKLSVMWRMPQFKLMFFHLENWFLDVTPISLAIR